MQVRVKEQVLSPTVKDGEKTDFRAEVFGISGDGAQGLGRGTKENAVDHLFVLIGEGGNLFRQGEDDVEYSTGSSSAWRSWSHLARARDWHLGQWRFRQL